MDLDMASMAPENGHLSVSIQITATVNFSSVAARRKVTGFVVDEISTNMHGGEPTLVIGERICWRVPIILSMPPIGDRGEVGAINVDVESGQMNVSQELIQEIEHRAELLTAGSSRSTAS
jgi:hypothetical protein